MTNITTTTTTNKAIAPTMTDEDSGFESQPSKFNTTVLDNNFRPLTSAVNEWLKRSNSPGLFVTSSDNVSYEEDEEGDDESLSNEPPKNLQSNPMLVLSVRGSLDNKDKPEPTPSILPIPDELKAISAINDCTKSRSARRRAAKKKKKADKDQIDSRSRQFNNIVQRDCCHVSAKEQICKDCAQSERKLDGIYQSAEIDRDASMRVAKKPRMNAREVNNWSDEDDDDDDDGDDDEDSKVRGIRKEQLVRTYEKGEIVVSLEGELLLVNQERRKSAMESDERSLGSIDEPDVLECWEAETIEPLNELKHINNEESTNKVESIKNVKHFQTYYRLQDDSSITSTEDEYVAPRSCLVVEERPTSVDQADDQKIPLDEAFEVYESCYTGGKSLPNTFSDGNGSKSLFFARDREGAIPCRAVCCNIQ